MTSIGKNCQHIFYSKKMQRYQGFSYGIAVHYRKHWGQYRFHVYMHQGKEEVFETKKAKYPSANQTAQRSVGISHPQHAFSVTLRLYLQNRFTFNLQFCITI